MTKGDRRRNRRRYRIRYDRIIVLVLILAILIVLITSCVKAITKKEEPEPETSSSQSEQTDTETSEAPETPSGDAEPVTEAPTDDGYTTVRMTADDMAKGSLILVNHEYDYKFPEGDVDPVTVYDHRNDYYQVGDYVTKMDLEVLNKINAMMEAFCTAENRADSNIFLIDGYRTLEEQQDRYSGGKSSFEPGHSDYHTGRTFDIIYFNDEGISDYFRAEGQYEWFASNAEKYGFVVRFPEDKSDSTGERPRPYTYRYVGVPHAAYMNANGLCMEEYIEELRTYTKDEPLVINGDAMSYTVYFVAADASGSTDVPVPRDKSYTVSGNNVDGFVVTVTN